MAKFCAPSKDHSKESCFNQDSLKRIVLEWNRKNPTKQIKKTKSTEIVKELGKLSRDTPCDEEYCLLKNNFFRKHIIGKPQFLEIEHDTFVPEMPKDWKKDPKAWLSTTDIREVLLQYEFKYPEFEFLGPTPIDFDHQLERSGYSKPRCVSDEFCKIDLAELYKQGKRKIGMVFNLDPHDMPGSHWVSAFVNLDNGGIFYFDSVGKFPCREIQDLMFRIRKQGNDLLYNGTIPIKKWNTKYNIPVKFRSPSSNEYLDNQSYIEKEELLFVEDTIPPFLEDMILLVKNNKTSQKGGKLKKIIHRIKGVQEGGLLIESPIKKRNREHLDKEGDVCGFRMFWNDTPMQKENTECGMYSIHFIQSLLEGVDFEDYTNNILRDGDLNEMRSVFYRPYIDSKNKK